MTTIKIDFEWTRGRRYEHVPYKGGGAIRQTDKGGERFNPLDLGGATSLAVTFAGLNGSSEGCVDFATHFGLLTTPARFGAAEPLDIWQREIRRMKSLISMTDVVRAANSRRIRMKMATLNVGLQSGLPGRRPALVLWPQTLLDAMIVQFAQSKASGRTIRVCQQCGNWFEQGLDAKRSVAKFCSDRCRNRYHYELKTA
jgi:hypothetical protein